MITKHQTHYKHACTHSSEFPNISVRIIFFFFWYSMRIVKFWRFASKHKTQSFWCFSRVCFRVNLRQKHPTRKKTPQNIQTSNFFTTMEPARDKFLLLCRSTLAVLCFVIWFILLNLSYFGENTNRIRTRNAQHFFAQYNIQFLGLLCS